MRNQFCFLKGIVECESGTIQDCNNKRTTFCPAERAGMDTEQKKNGFCFLKGMVSCSPGMIQDCNIKRVRICPNK